MQFIFNLFRLIRDFPLNDFSVYMNGVEHTLSGNPYTQKFFDYFDLPRNKLKEQFKDFDGIAESIEEKEEEIKKIREEQKKRAEEDVSQIILFYFFFGLNEVTNNSMNHNLFLNNEQCFFQFEMM